MFNMQIIQKLQERGFINQLTDEKILINNLSQRSITLYCGFDPTADSLHLGHLIPLLCLKYFQQCGHKPIILIGGATSLIGDPSFKVTKRIINTENNIKEWISKIIQQIKIFLDFNCGDNSAVIVNNYDWFSNMNLLTFLRKIGLHFSINQMINKEAVKQRIKRNSFGISFTEFSYNLLQSYDFAHLYDNYNVELQIGGSDQWGNITSGINLIHRLYKTKVFGLTVPLITKSDGTKFSKTQINDAIWLDPKKTSPYKFYQYWINSTDVDVYNFLKLFTFMSINDINELQKYDQNSSIKPKAQYILAEKITKLVHGLEGLEIAKRITKNLFFNNIQNLKISDFIMLAQDGIPTIELNMNIDLQQVLVRTNIVSSRSEARRLIISKAIKINGVNCIDIKYIFSTVDYLFGCYSLIKHGKKNFYLIHWY